MFEFEQTGIAAIQQLGVAGIELITAALKSNSVIKVPGLTANTSLEELSLASCGITGKGMELLLAVLKENNSIKSLDLGYAPST